jgi:hypothetical protein
MLCPRDLTSRRKRGFDRRQVPPLVVELLLAQRIFWTMLFKHYNGILSFGMVPFMTFTNEKTMIVVLQRGNAVVASRYTQ